MNVEESCPDSLVLDNQTISGTQTFTAGIDITAGPNLIVNGTAIELIAGDHVVFTNGVEVGGSLIVAIDVGACVGP
jgi:hypothetical protein